MTFQSIMLIQFISSHSLYSTKRTCSTKLKSPNKVYSQKWIQNQLSEFKNNVKH